MMLVALRLEPAQDEPKQDDPSLDDLAVALERPTRPLFLGRKPALPSAPILFGRCDAANIRAALMEGGARATARNKALEKGPWRAEWPAGEGEGGRELSICDERRWQIGVHGGLRAVMQGQLSTAEIGQ